MYLSQDFVGFSALNGHKTVTFNSRYHESYLVLCYFDCNKKLEACLDSLENIHCLLLKSSAPLECYIQNISGVYYWVSFLSELG